MSEEFEQPQDPKPDQADTMAHLSDQIEALDNKMDTIIDMLTEMMGDTTTVPDQTLVVNSDASIAGATWL